MLESMSEVTMSGTRSWKLLDTLGRSWLDLPESLRADLLTWRLLMGIGERSKKVKAGTDG